MKVLFIASDNNLTSGAFLSMSVLARLLKEDQGIEPMVVIPRKGEGIKLLKEYNIPFVFVRSIDWIIPIGSKLKIKTIAKRIVSFFVNAVAAIRIAAIAKRETIDIIHLNTSYPYVGALAAKISHRPFVWHLREFLEEDQGREIWNKRKGYKLISDATQIIAISNSIRDKYIDLLPSDKLSVVFNGIDVERFYNKEKKIFQKKTITLMYGGGYATRKGIYELSSAVQLLYENGIENFRLIFIGEPNRKFRDHIRKSVFADHCSFVGYQKNVETWYEKADIAFSCSASEAFGRKTVEAMLCGTLVIASDTGGTLDIIQDGKTGLLYKQGNPVSLFQKLLYAIRHQEECSIIASSGREFAKNSFDARKNAENITKIYRTITEEKRG